MAKRRVGHYKRKSAASDKGLMLLAACAAVIVGFFAIFSYKSESVTAIPTPTPNIVTVPLSVVNRSGESGTVAFQEVDGKVVVSILMSGYVKGAVQPVQIRLGSCSSVGAIKYPLTSVAAGQSTTTLDTTLDALRAMGTMSVGVHKSVASGAYVSCGNLGL